MGGLRRMAMMTIRAVAAGALIVLALPPFGWWPLAFVGIAVWDRLLAEASWKQRLRRSFLVGVAWFFPSMVWLYDFTPPGYVVAAVLFSAIFAVAGALVPPGPVRWIAFPATLALATQVMAVFPFGGVPMAGLALTQSGSCGPPCTPIDSPLPQAARLLGPLLVTALVGVGGIALSAAWERRGRATAIALAIVVVTVGIGMVAPRGTDIGPLHIAVVQGGGPQHTPPGNGDAYQVFQAHLDATRQLVEPPVDLVLWPENVVSVTGRLDQSVQSSQLAELARELHTTIIVGATEDAIGEPTFLNASIVYNPDGSMGERFDKVQRVPFGEYVPFRDLIKRIAGDQYLPARDALPGTGHGTLPTQVGTMGVVISWEDFFSERARDAIGHGGEVLLNPTNGASYWLTQVQTQQLASSRLRAIETGRWTVQAAPTGFSAVFAPNGALLARTDLEERIVIDTTIERREGNTLATLVGPSPMVGLSLAAVVTAWVLARRRRDLDDQTSSISVTGPSLTSSTAMSAPNRPVSTDAPS